MSFQNPLRKGPSKAALLRVNAELEEHITNLNKRIYDLRLLCDSLEAEDYEIIGQLTAANAELTRKLKETEDKLFAMHGLEGHEVQT